MRDEAKFPDPAPSLASLSDDLASRVEDLNIAGAAIAVQYGKHRVEAYAGHANTETGIAVDAHTIFQIGSTTKVFTATLVMLLVDQGKIDLDAPVTAYLPELQVDGIVAPDSMTVRTLLNYTSGVESDLFQPFGPDPIALQEYVHAVRELIFVHEPGQMHNYNSTAYCIAARVIEVVTGKFFNEALAELLLEPLGISDYCFYDENVARFRTAVGHEWGAPDANRFRICTPLRMPEVLSAAGASLTMSARELLTFGMFHAADGTTTTGEQLVSSDRIVEMREPSAIVPPNAKEVLTGWTRLPSNKSHLTVASGATIGQNSLLAISPENEFGIAILANVAHGAELLFFELGLKILEEVTGIVPVIDNSPGSAPELHSLKPSEITTDDYTGYYRNSAEVTVVEQNGVLVMESRFSGDGIGGEQRSIAKLFALGNDKFAVVPEGGDAAQAVIEFIRSGEPDGEVTHLFAQNRLYRRTFQR